MVKPYWRHGMLAILCYSISPVSQVGTPVSDSEMPEVILETQSRHAREILGERWIADAEVEFSPKAMAAYIFEVLEGSLKGRWKSQAYRIAQTLINESNRYEMDPLFLLALIERESQFRPEAVGRQGEIGLMQIKPATAKWMQQKTGLHLEDLFDAVDNIRVGIAYLHYLRDAFERDSTLYISAYNLGPTKLRALLKTSSYPSIYHAHLMRNYQLRRLQAVRYHAVLAETTAAARVATGW